MFANVQGGIALMVVAVIAGVIAVLTYRKKKTVTADGHFIFIIMFLAVGAVFYLGFTTAFTTT